MDEQEVKKLMEDIGKTTKELRDSVDAKIATAIKGAGVGEIETKIAAIQTHLNELKDNKKELERLHASIDRLAHNVGPTDSKGQKQPEDYLEVKKAYDGFLRKGEGAGNSGGKQEFSYEKKSLAVISDVDGGYTVTADMNGRVIERIWETSPMRAVANVQSISSDALEGLIDQDQAAVGWVGETGVRPGTANPVWGKWRIPVHELYAMPAASQKMLDDSSVDMEAWLAKKVADRMGRFENTAFVSGDGNAKPRGFLTYPHSATINTEQGNVQQVNSGSAASLTFDSLKAIVAALKKPYRMKGTFVCTRSTVGVISQLKDLYGRYLWEPSLQLGQPDRIMGYAFEEFADMPELGASNLALAFADFNEFYQVVDRIGLRVLRDPYTAKPYVLFYTTKRTGGDVHNWEAGKILKCSV